MHLRQTSDASAGPQSQRSLHFIFASCFRLSSSFALSLLLKFLPAVNLSRSHTSLAIPLPHLPLSLGLPIFIIAAIIWQMLLSPAPVSSVFLQLSLFLLPLPTSYSIPAPCSSLPALLSLSLSRSAIFATISQRSPRPAATVCVLALFVFLLHLPKPLLPLLLLFFCYCCNLFDCLRHRCCAPPRDQP